MNKKASFISLALLITAAVFLGFVFVNKGDGPVMGAIFSDRYIENLESYINQEKSAVDGNYLILAKEFNKYKEKHRVYIPSGKDLYSNIHIVESPKGSKFTAKWMSEGKIIKEETKALSTNQKGIISYLLEGNNADKGTCLFELYYEGRKLLETTFEIK